MSYATQVVADGAVAYWRLGEASGTTVRSTVAGVPDGTISGASFTRGIPGALADGDAATAFNPAGGADTYATVPDGAYNDLGTGPATVECWFRSSTIPVGYTPTIFGSGLIQAAGRGIGFFLYTGGSVLRFRTREATGAATDLTGPTIVALCNGQWRHLVGVVRRGTPNDTAELWVDGAQFGATVSLGTGLDYTSTAGAVIGGENTLTDVVGDIDECALYKVALTPAQIAAHYAARATTYPGYVLADGAVAYWRLGETSGTVVKSLVAGVPDGTLAGAVTLGVPGALADGDPAMTFNPSGAADGGIAVPVGSYSAIGTGPATIECWVKTTAVPAVVQVVYGTTNLGASFAGVGFRTTVAGELLLRARDVALAVSDVLVPSSAWTDGQWHHAVGVIRRGASDTLELWLDGVLKTSATIAAPGRDFTSTTTTVLGATGTAQEWTGTLDECALYKVALTPAQIQAHYAAAAPLPHQQIAAWVMALEGDWMQPYNDWRPVTPSDSVDLAAVAQGLWVGGAGTVAAVMQNNTMPVVLVGVPAGTYLPIAVRRVNLTGTTATGIVALYGV